MKLYKFSVLLVLISFWGCEPAIKNIENSTNNVSLTVVSGDNQTGLFGEILKDSIILKATGKTHGRAYKITYKIIQGNGKILNAGFYGITIADSLGKTKFLWRVGGDNAVQKVRFYVYADSLKSTYGGSYDLFANNPSDSVTVVSTSDKPKGWGLSSGLDDNIDYFGADMLSFDNQTIYLVNRKLFYSTDRGVNWVKKENIPNDPDIKFAQFNSKGWLYLATSDQGVMFTKDLKTWESINSGIVGSYRNPSMFLVEDSTLFVSFDDDGPYRTSDNGKFWKKLLVGSNTGRFQFIKRHPDGRLFMFDKRDTFWMSANNGDNWQSVNLNANYTGSEAYDLNIDKNGTIYLGGDDAIFSALDSKTYTGYSKKYYQWNASTQSVNRIKIVYNDVYYLVCYTPTPGLYSVNNAWKRIELGFSKPICNYYLKSDNTFILISYDGLYYYNKN